MNLNKFAKKITLKEGKKKSISIAQVKEVLRLCLIELGNEDDFEILKTINRYRKK